jgi:hypothetical protein
MIPPGQIAAADTFPEKYIAADKEVLFRGVKTDTGG